MIPFNVPTFTGNERRHIEQVLQQKVLCGNGPYTRLCEKWFETNFGGCRVLMTSSCTHALEMAALVLDIQPGDEVIMPSFTFVSTANAFALRGATIVFVDVRPDTMNIDESCIEAAITARTKAIVPVHYAGIACEMEAILEIARRHGLWVVEDAAQAVLSCYKGKALGTLGHLGCYSFHETKNFTCGEGGALAINDLALVERAEMIQEKGTNRSAFYRGEVDKYTWLGLGSSYLLSELQAAYLYGQLEWAERIVADRMANWQLYDRGLRPLADGRRIGTPGVPAGCAHNAHMFYIKARGLAERTALMGHLKERHINTVFHYVPLHISPAGRRLGRFHGDDRHTTPGSERLLRLPLHYGLAHAQTQEVVEAIRRFYG